MGNAVSQQESRGPPHTHTQAHTHILTRGTGVQSEKKLCEHTFTVLLSFSEFHAEFGLCLCIDVLNLSVHSIRVAS